MRAADLLKNTSRRAARPSGWAAVLVFGGLWNAARILLLTAPLHWEEVVLPFALGLVAMVLSPVPWQWTADDRPLASLPRGVLQAVPWNLAWLAAVFLLLPFHGPGEGGQGGGMGPGGGGMGRGRGGRWAAEARAEPSALSPRMLALAAAAFAFSVAFGLALAQKEGAERLEEEARDGLRAAQARALQAQMNPHALFNLVSALTEMAREDPAATEASLERLAALLRRLLDHAARTCAPLADERALVEDQLELERIRLGPRLRVAWDWDPSLDRAEAQPLLLQPLVENALKHGIAAARDGGDLRISARRERDLAVLEVANTGAPLVPGPERLGLSNLRQRLELLGGGRAQLSLGARDGWTVAAVRVPLVDHG